LGRAVIDAGGHDLEGDSSADQDKAAILANNARRFYRFDTDLRTGRYEKIS